MGLNADKVLKDVGYKFKKGKVSSMKQKEQEKVETKSVPGNVINVDWKTVRRMIKSKKIQQEEQD